MADEELKRGVPVLLSMCTHQVPEGVHLHAEVMHSLGVVLVVQLNHLPVVLPHCSLLSFFMLESIQRVVILL